MTNIKATTKATGGRWLWLTLGLIMASLPALAGETDKPPTGTGNYHEVEFARLSDQNVSRRGAVLLKMPGLAWVHGESDHFVFHFERGFLCPQLATAIELFYGRIKLDLGIATDAYERKAHVFVFLHPERWQEFAAETKIEPWSAAVQIGNELFACARANQRLDASPNLPHELTHLVVKRFVGDVPLWLNEGVAQVEGARARVQYLRARGASMRIPLPDLAVESKLPMAELTGFVDYPADDATREIFYRQSELVVWFLMEQGGNEEAFRQFLKLQSQGLSFASALDKAFGSQLRNVEAFEKSFTGYVHRKRQP
jgi:hypothetical protein